MEISVIVPALNEEDHIKSCLKSILDQDFPKEKYEVIVSDGNSCDRTVEIARKYADKVVVSRKRGIWFGRNFGAKFAKGKYLVFIDADTMIRKDYLSLIYKHLEKGFVGVSTAFSFSDKSLKIWIAEPFANAYYILKNLWGFPYLLGFNISMPRTVFDEIGGFKEFGLEDIKMSEELKKHGKTVFLAKKKAITSPRRLEAFGLFGALRYYSELLFILKKNVDPSKHKRIFKYKTYCKVDKDFEKDSKKPFTETSSAKTKSKRKAK